ncbi:hypothetical protein VNO78_25936 [Psophocarpus tetragonolobus]|uniref:Yos1-like protein n=1 Tax=Psophocarpus tetragonolobus TaxID=3891 RepID=A0AAN9XG84_PSOTE
MLKLHSEFSMTIFIRCWMMETYDEALDQTAHLYKSNRVRSVSPIASYASNPTDTFSFDADVLAVAILGRWMSLRRVLGSPSRDFFLKNWFSDSRTRRRSLFFLFPLKMGFWTFLEGLLLFANALAILNEDRFLAPRGWTLAEMTGPQRNSLKGQVIGVIYACQFLRLPLILFNVITIIVKLVSG